MYLNREEERMLRGDAGEGISLCMRLLVALGDLLEARRMVRVESAHVSGVAYQNIGDTGLEFLENLASSGARARVKTTVNPAGLDTRKWRRMGVAQRYAERQMRILHALRKLGAAPSYTCIPYEGWNVPDPGDIIAWGESSAVIYANSVLQARTNRESGLTALASAITGKTPLGGFHLRENRKPNLLVKVETNLSGYLKFSALGYLVGKQFNNAIPLFAGIKKAKGSELKALSSGLGSAGAVALFHLRAEPPSGLEKIETVTVSETDLNATIRELSSPGPFDCVILGCPQCDASQLRAIARMLEGKRVRRPLWICTSRRSYRAAADTGLVKQLASSGCQVFCDTCAEVCPLKDIGFHRVLTDSCKAAHYISSIGRVEVELRETRDCVGAALG